MCESTRSRFKASTPGPGDHSGARALPGGRRPTNIEPRLRAQHPADGTDAGDEQGELYNDIAEQR